MTQPLRIQRSRAKGWRMSAAAIYVGRPSRWGNPFKVEGAFALEIAGEAVYQATWQIKLGPDERGQLKEMYASWIAEPAQAALRGAIQRELRGRPLVCWCPLDQPCHADVLLELANR